MLQFISGIHVNFNFSMAVHSKSISQSCIVRKSLEPLGIPADHIQIQQRQNLHQKIPALGRKNVLYLRILKQTHKLKCPLLPGTAPSPPIALTDIFCLKDRKSPFPDPLYCQIQSGKIHRLAVSVRRRRDPYGITIV